MSPSYGRNAPAVPTRPFLRYHRAAIGGYASTLSGEADHANWILPRACRFDRCGRPRRACGDREPYRGAGGARHPHRREAEPERHLAGHQHGQLGSPCAHRQARGCPARGLRQSPRACGAGAGARLRRLRAGGRGGGRGQRDPEQAGGGGDRAGERGALARSRSGGPVLHARHPARNVHAVSAPDHAESRQDPDGLRVRKRQPHDFPRRRAEATRRQVDGPLGRPLGRQHGGHPRDQLQRSPLVLARGRLPHRRARRRRAVHAHDGRCAALRGDHHGFERLHAAMEDEHGALPSARGEPDAAGVQVQRVRRGNVPRPPAQEPAGEALGRRYDHPRRDPPGSRRRQTIRAVSNRSWRHGDEKDSSIPVVSRWPARGGHARDGMGRDDRGGPAARGGAGRDSRDVGGKSGVGTEKDVARAYNEFWFGDKPTRLSYRTSMIIDPPDGRMPALTPEAARRIADKREFLAALLQGTSGGRQGPISPPRADRAPDYNLDRINRTDGPEDRGGPERCLGDNLPVTMGTGTFGGVMQLVQSPDSVSIYYDVGQGQGFAWVIPITNRPHVPKSLQLYHGDAIGRWDGDTLVVDVTNFSDETSFRGARENLHLVQRFRRVDANTLQVEFTAEDPTTWVRPWTAVQELEKADEKTTLVLEGGGHEGNYGLLGMLLNTRAAEKAFAEGKGPDPATQDNATGGGGDN